MQKIQQRLLPLMGALFCLHASSCSKQEEGGTSSSDGAGPRKEREGKVSEAVALTKAPAGVTALTFIHDGRQETRIALKLDTPGSTGSDSSLIAIPWSDPTLPKRAYHWENNRWSKASEITVRGGYLIHRDRSSTRQSHPKPEAWFDPSPESAAIGIRTATKELTEAMERAKRSAEERKQIQIDSIKEQLVEIEMQQEELQREQQTLRDSSRRPGAGDPRRDLQSRRTNYERTRAISREMSQLRNERTGLNARIDDLSEEPPEFEVEFIQFSDHPSPTQLPEGGFAVLGHQLATPEGVVSDASGLMKALEPSLEDLWAWVEWGNARSLRVNIEGTLEGAPSGTAVEVRPVGDAQDLFAEKPRKFSIGRSGSFSIRFSINRSELESERPFKLELVRIMRDGDEKALGTWSAILAPTGRRVPIKIVNGGGHLPWKLKQAEEPKVPEGGIKVVSHKEHSFGGHVMEVTAANHGRLLAAVIEGEANLRYFDTWKADWTEGPEFDGSDSVQQLAGDASRLFVVDQEGKRLRSIALSDGRVLAETKLTHPVLDIAAGESAITGPLAVLTSTYAELRDPHNLQIIQRIVNPRRPTGTPLLSSKTDMGYIAAKTEASSGEVIAAPDASSFSITTVTGADRRRSDQWMLSSSGLTWTFEKKSEFPGWQGLHYTSSSIARPGAPNKDRIQIEQFSIRDLLPTSGIGHLCLEAPRSLTLPARPVPMAYYAGEFQAARFQGPSLAHTQTGVDRNRIWFDPIRARLITAGDTSLSVAQLETEAFHAAIPLESRLGVPPTAAPGTTWTYHPAGTGTTVEVTSTKPEVEISVEADRLGWEVPANIQAAIVELSLSIDGAETTVRIPVGELPPVRFLEESGVASTATGSVLSLEKVERLIPIPGSNLLIASRNGGAGITLIDVEKQKAIKDLWLPGGVAAIAPAGDRLHLYYPDMGILETRSLPDFTPISSDSLSFELPVKSISAAANSPIRVILAKSFHQIELIKLDSETMTPQTTATVEGPRLGDDSQLVPATTTADGSIIQVKNSLLRLEGDRWVELKIPSEIRPHTTAPISIGPDAFTIYGTKGLSDIDTGRVWLGPTEEPRTISCGPSTSSGFFLVARRGNDGLSVEIRDTDRKDLIASINDLTEFEAGREKVQDDQIIPRTIYMPAINTLVTLAIGDRDLIIRKLPSLEN